MLSALDSYKQNGYCKIKIFNSLEVDSLIKSILCTINKKAKTKISNNNISFYHKLTISDKTHSKIIKNNNRYIRFEKKLLDRIYNNKNIKNLTNYIFGLKSNSIIKWVGNANKNQYINNASGFRIARPYKYFKDDVGGVHTDFHYGGKIRTQNNLTFTVWTPLIGFNDKYTLRISAKSHKKNHSVNSISSQQKYISPVVNENYSNKFKYIRPNMKKGDVIIFDPNLLHGGSLNYGTKTRLSLDFRFFDKNIFIK